MPTYVFDAWASVWYIGIKTLSQEGCHELKRVRQLRCFTLMTQYSIGHQVMLCLSLLLPSSGMESEWNAAAYHSTLKNRLCSSMYPAQVFTEGVRIPCRGMEPANTWYTHSSLVETFSQSSTAGVWILNGVAHQFVPPSGHKAINWLVRKVHNVFLHPWDWDQKLIETLVGLSTRPRKGWLTHQKLRGGLWSHRNLRFWVHFPKIYAKNN